MIVQQDTLEIEGLHNLADDPCELHDLRETAPVEIRERLLQHLRGWKERIASR